MMARQPIHVLLIEDNPADVGVITRALTKNKQATFQLIHAEELAKGVDHLQQGGIHVILLDLMLQDSRGIETLVRARTHAFHVPIVILTAADDEGLAVQTLQMGAQDYLVKAHVEVYPELLGRAIRYAIERKSAEEALRSAHLQTEKLLASVPSILIGLSPEGRVTHWNAVAESVFGLSAAQMVHQSLSEGPIQWDAARLLVAFSQARTTGKSAWLDEIGVTHPNGHQRTLVMTLVPMRSVRDELAGFLLVGEDVTARKQAEAERAQLQGRLQEAQKLETVGRFAWGIAHDFQNFLQVILGFAWLMRSRCQEHQEHPQSRELQSDVNEIMHAAESASGMIRQLLAFSRRQALKPTVLEINQTLRNMERVLQQCVGEPVHLVLQLDEHPLLMKADPTAFEQIVINLCSNARDSMPTGGTVTIRTAPARVQPALLKTSPWAKPGQYIRISIEDTGTGMGPDVVAHIFEPFFTTKSQGKGTGLGLAVVYGLMQQHEGVIEVTSALNVGTTFHLYFPHREVLHAQADGVVAAPEPMADGKPALRTGRPRVLIVDDDPAILSLCARMLSTVCDVKAVPSAPSAMEALTQVPYDLLLTDLIMPEMDGFALIDAVTKRTPALKVAVMTGSLTDEAEQRLRAASIQVIHKPFTGTVLQEFVLRQ